MSCHWSWLRKGVTTQLLPLWKRIQRRLRLNYKLNERVKSCSWGQNIYRSSWAMVSLVQLLEYTSGVCHSLKNGLGCCIWICIHPRSRKNTWNWVRRKHNNIGEQWKAFTPGWSLYVFVFSFLFGCKTRPTEEESNATRKGKPQRKHRPTVKTGKTPHKQDGCRKATPPKRRESNKQQATRNQGASKEHEKYT